MDFQKTLMSLWLVGLLVFSVKSSMGCIGQTVKLQMERIDEPKGNTKIPAIIRNLWTKCHVQFPAERQFKILKGEAVAVCVSTMKTSKLKRALENSLKQRPSLVTKDGWTKAKSAFLNRIKKNPEILEKVKASNEGFVKYYVLESQNAQGIPTNEWIIAFTHNINWNASASVPVKRQTKDDDQLGKNTVSQEAASAAPAITAAPPSCKDASHVETNLKSDDKPNDEKKTDKKNDAKAIVKSAGITASDLQAAQPFSETSNSPDNNEKIIKKLNETSEDVKLIQKDSLVSIEAIQNVINDATDGQSATKDKITSA